MKKKILCATAFVLGTGVLLCSGNLSRLVAQETPAPVPPLRAVFNNKLLVGTAISSRALQGRDDATLNLGLQQFNAFTAENSMKPDSIERTQGEFHWTDADTLVEKAEKAGVTVVGHTLVWHQQTPQWFFQGENGQPVTREVALERLRTYIKTVVGRYKGRIKQWDVVNEAISDNPNEFLRPTPWLKAIGEDYIAEAFRAAHEADPDAILVYNDYSNDHGSKRDRTLRLAKMLLDQGVPINAIGMQCHWQLGRSSIEEAEKSIEQYGALGLKVMVTELDISVLKSRNQGADISVREDGTSELNPYVNGLPPEVAQQQAEMYRRAFEVFLRHSDVVKRVTVWGTTDGMSWLNNYPIRGRTDYPLFFDRQGLPKPAFFAVQQVGQKASLPTP